MIETVSQTTILNRKIGKNYWTMPGNCIPRNMDPETLEEAICREFKTQKEFLTDKIKKDDRIFAKHFYRYFFRSILKWTEQKVGYHCNCDRCTVIHSVKTTRDLFDTDREFRGRVQRIIDKHHNKLIRYETEKA